MTQQQKDHFKENWVRYLNSVLLVLVLGFLGEGLNNESKLSDDIKTLQETVSQIKVQDSRISNIETILGQNEVRINSLEQNIFALGEQDKKP